MVNFTHSRQVFSLGATLNLPQGRGVRKTSQIFFGTVLFLRVYNNTEKLSAMSREPVLSFLNTIP
jgi:hypothetical protein